MKNPFPKFIKPANACAACVTLFHSKSISNKYRAKHKKTHKRGTHQGEPPPPPPPSSRPSPLPSRCARPLAATA